MLSELAVSDPSAAAQARYLLNAAHCPPYRNTECEYFPLGDDAYPKMLEAIESAERFIFLEYFIIEEGHMWNSILELLVKKAAAEILDSASLYLQICIGASVGQLTYNAAAAILRSVGDSRTPLLFLILSSVLNILLDLIFVLVFRMGVAAARTPA